ncbi:sugar kinase [Algisphaera agarilytica]|uniref:2-dehydro-3-deoxygluconokinase n=1 Tax=Algisphaera agarilytica TaxID=1385975 RepID=A0A7X0H515_9BACT|nr:sugar kinase [Algisphaera agarilytica]MBB6429157.1 2-dehydro-3-deoxygluconokinase [Algisphaera agarilytica]
MKPVVGFGEIMCRLACPERLRLRQTRALDVTYAGAEASVCASICNFGGSARYVTALPNNALGEAAMDTIRAVGIDASHIVRPEHGRMGLYFLETGANQRPSNVLYDRADAAVAITPADQYDWEAIFEGAGWLHLSGITPALSEVAADATERAAKAAQQAGVPVSIDLNFRKKLWGWSPDLPSRELARQVMGRILPQVSVVIANEEDCADVLDIRAGDTDVEAGSLEIDGYPLVARRVVEQFPNVQKVAITLRESLSANHNNWGAMLYDSAEDKPYFAPLNDNADYQPYEIKNIVDRVGGGDSFAGGLIFALNTPALQAPGDAVRYAVAASCLKHSIKGDFNFSTRPEVEALMHGAASGRVVR